jgi:hypothetical protein
MFLSREQAVRREQADVGRIGLFRAHALLSSRL